MQLITPIFLIIISIGIFFGYVDPAYKEVKAAKVVEAQYDDELSRSRELQDIRAELLSEYNSFDKGSIDRLEKLLPDNIDNVRLIMEMDSVAKSHGLTIKNLSLTGDSTKPAENEAETQIGPDGKPYSSMQLKFSVAAKYNQFLSFMNDLEGSLRLVDVTSIDFKTLGNDFDEYTITIKTYWLK